ncbi:cytochrome c biogenesis protein CcsA [Opitutus sp. ER46]|uniref:cytochrome C assembly family protein n=1 Tax=Opitutus sp. ER46 TaxID=2161864 RepID=UPI001E5B59F6|nr:cytochrome c biogenesis protein CcsA [Opitutus sp. ER46]
MLTVQRVFSQISDRTWLWVAAALYLLGFLQGTVSLLRGGRPSGYLTYTLILAGYAVQLIGLGIRGRAVAGCPLGNTFELYQFIAWSAITLYVVVGVTFRNSLLGYFTSCLTAVLMLVSLAIPGWDAAQRTHIFGSNPWIELHAALAVFSYGVFALLAMTSLMFLLRNYSLQSKKIGGWFSFLPSIIDLDHIGVRLLSAGVAILTVSLAIIWMFWLRAPQTAALTKVIAAMIIWAVGTAVLGLRLRGLLLSRRFAWACLVLFIGALGSLVAVDHNRRPAPAAAISAA